MFWPPPPGLVTINVARPNYDSRGNRKDSRGNPLPAPGDTGGTFTVNAVVSTQVGLTLPHLGEGQEIRFLQNGKLYVPRGTDVRPGDEILYNGVNYVVSGHARSDQNHPFTNEDFGWMEFEMQGIG